MYEKFEVIWSYDAIMDILENPILLPLWFAMALNYEPNVNVKVYV